MERGVQVSEDGVGRGSHGLGARIGAESVCGDGPKIRAAVVICLWTCKGMSSTSGCSPVDVPSPGMTNANHSVADDSQAYETGPQLPRLIILLLGRECFRTRQERPGDQRRLSNVGRHAGGWTYRR